MSRERYTVFGATGFIGRHVVERIRRSGAEVAAAARDHVPRPGEDLGRVVYCIGLTADWRGRPIETVHAHVGKLAELLERGTFTRLVYLSSTRVYKRTEHASEDAVLGTAPGVPDDLFDLSKMLGEALCVSDQRAVVARISNVYGDDYRSDNFLSSVLRDALRGHLVVRTSRESSKDYVGVDEVADVLVRMADGARARIYNVGAGANTPNGALLDELVRLTGCHLELAADAPTIRFPTIDISRARHDLDFSPRPVLDALPGLVSQFRAHRELWENT